MRVVPKPITRLPGPSQSKEQFNHPAIPASVNRALNQLQLNVQNATSQAKARPDQNQQLIRGWSVQDSGFGSTPLNIIPHNLGQPYAGFVIWGVYGGWFAGYYAVQDLPTLAQYPLDSFLVLNIALQIPGSTIVTSDILVYC
jgi:hypothetical protein